MRLIESYGTGIGKIIRLYSGEGKEPQFETAKGAFRVTLPNRNEDEPKARFAEPLDTLPENAAGAGLEGSGKNSVYMPVK